MSASNTSLATLGPVSGADVPAISIDGFDRYLVTYSRPNSSSGHSDIFSRRDFLPSFIGSEPQVSLNPQATPNFGSDNASSSNGTSVAVWVNSFSNTDHDIWAQRFDQFGNPTGAPIQVDFLGSDNSFDPHVSMDSTGRFVVAWVNFNADGTSNIIMRCFSASGSPLTDITRVSNPGSTDFNPDVAASNGSFVISWTHQASATDLDIDAERFVISGGVPAGQGIFFVNIDTNREEHSSVAMSPDGSFDIAYERLFSDSDGDIFANQYNGSGSFLRSVTVNFDSNEEFSPSVSMDNSGNAVIAYAEIVSSNSGIYANRLSTGGSLSGRITVQNVGGVNAFDPSVALAPSGGQFVVAYDISGSTVQVTEISASNTSLATLGPVPGEDEPAISIDGFDRYLVTYPRFNSSSGHVDVFSRRDFLS